MSRIHRASILAIIAKHNKLCPDDKIRLIVHKNNVKARSNGYWLHPTKGWRKNRRDPFTGIVAHFNLTHQALVVNA